MSKRVTKLCEECSAGNLKIVKKIIKGSLFYKAVPVNSFSTEKKSPTAGMTPLMCASINGNLKIVQYLVAEGADLDARDLEGGNTSLMYAAAHGQLYVAEYLVGMGADVNIQNTISGNTPLMYAAAHNKADIIELLLKNKADKKLRNKDGLDAFQMAKKRRYAGIIPLLKDNTYPSYDNADPELYLEKVITDQEQHLNNTVEKYLTPLRLHLGGARAWGKLHGAPLIREYPQYKKVREIGILAHEEIGHDGLHLLMEHIRSDGSDLYKYLELLWYNLKSREGEKIWLM